MEKILTISWRYRVLEIDVPIGCLWTLARAFSNAFSQVDAMEGDVVIRSMCGYRTYGTNAFLRVRLHEDEAAKIQDFLDSFRHDMGIARNTMNVCKQWIGFDVLFPMKSDVGWKFMDEFEGRFGFGTVSGSSPTAIERYGQRNEGTLSIIVLIEPRREQEFITFARDFCQPHEMTFKESWRLDPGERDAVVA